MNQPACNKMQQKSTWIKSINVLRTKLDYLFCIVSFMQCSVQNRQLNHCPQLMVSPISSVSSSWIYPTSFDFNISAKQQYTVFKHLHLPGGTAVTSCSVSCWAATLRRYEASQLHGPTNGCKAALKTMKRMSSFPSLTPFRSKERSQKHTHTNIQSIDELERYYFASPPTWNSCPLASWHRGGQQATEAYCVQNYTCNAKLVPPEQCGKSEGATNWGQR